MVECLTWDRGVAGSSLISINALCPWARHFNSCLILVQPKKTCPNITEKLGRKESNQTNKHQTKKLLFRSTSVGSDISYFNNKHSRPLSGSSYKSCLIWVCSVCKSTNRRLWGKGAKTFYTWLELFRTFLQVELPYRGKRIAVELRNQPEVFNSRVRFHGKSVLEGIRNLGTNGFATVPLPKHLTCVPSRARNYFLLAKKQTASQPEDTTGRSAVSLEQNRSTRHSSPVRVPNRTATPSEQNRTGQVRRSHTSHSSPVRVPSRTATPNEQNRTGHISKSRTSHSSPERVPNRTAKDVTTSNEQNRTAHGSISQNRTVTHSSPGKVNKRTGRESVSLNENSRAKPSLPLRERNQNEGSGSDSVKKQDRKVGGSVSLNVQKGKQSGETSRKEKNVKSNTKLLVKKVLAVNNSQNLTKSGDKR